MNTLVREEMHLETQNVTGNIERVIEYLEGMRMGMVAQGYTNIEFHLSSNMFTGEVEASFQYDRDAR